MFLQANKWACQKLGLPSAVLGRGDGEATLKRLFEKIDVDGSGGISREEFMNAMRKRDGRRKLMLKQRAKSLPAAAAPAPVEIHSSAPITTQPAAVARA